MAMKECLSGLLLALILFVVFIIMPTKYRDAKTEQTYILARGQETVQRPVFGALKVAKYARNDTHEQLKDYNYSSSISVKKVLEVDGRGQYDHEEVRKVIMQRFSRSN